MNFNYIHGIFFGIKSSQVILAPNVIEHKFMQKMKSFRATFKTEILKDDAENADGSLGRV